MILPGHIHVKLNLHLGAHYTLWLTACNEQVKSEPSSTVTYTRAGFEPQVGLLQKRSPPGIGSLFENRGQKWLKK